MTRQPDWYKVVRPCCCPPAVELTGAQADATFGQLKAKLSNEHIVDLVMTIAFYNAVVRVLASLEIDVEPEYQKYLDRHPLPKG